MWTENVDELEYVIFLNKLFSMVNRRPGRGRAAIYGSRHALRLRVAALWALNRTS